MSKIVLFACLSFLCSPVVRGQVTGKPDGQLTARELFFLPAAKPAQSSAAKPAAAKPPAKAMAKARPPASKTVPSRPVSAGQEELPEGAKVIAASNVTGGERPLGLRYSLLKVVGGGVREVGADTVFQSGDKIRVSFEANDRGYLYIVIRGSSGTWKLLFPSSEISGGNNRVEPMRQYVIPPAPSRFTFDETPGEEKLFIVLSRQPVKDLESLIYSLEEKPAAPKQLHYAMNKPVDDALVGRLRQGVYARDLVFEKVDEASPGDKKEQAVYVVNTTGRPDSRLVVDLKLEHR